jgi:hypothetical protein
LKTNISVKVIFKFHCTLIVANTTDPVIIGLDLLHL